MAIEKKIVTTLVIRGDSSNAVRQIKLTRKEIDLLTSANDQSVRAMAKNKSKLSGLTTQMAKYAVAAGSAYIAMKAGKEILRIADHYVVLSARIRVATKDTEEYESVSRSLYEITQQNSVAFEETAKLFQRISRSRADLKATTEEILILVDAVQQLGVIGGSTNEQMKNGLLQFSQGLSSGIFRAEEYNSLLENLPELANRIAEGMGKTAGELRQAVVDGEVLSKDVFDTLLKQADQIAADFAEMPITIARGSQELKTSLEGLVAQLTEAGSLSKSIGEWLSDAANAVDTLSGRRDGVSGLNEELAHMQALLDNGSFIGRSGAGIKAGLEGRIESLAEKIQLAKAAAGDLESIKSVIAGIESQMGAIDNKSLIVGTGRMKRETEYGELVKELSKWEEQLKNTTTAIDTNTSSVITLGKEQKKLLAIVLPLQAAEKKYAVESVMLNKIHEDGLMTSNELLSAQTALKLEYKELFPILTKAAEAEKNREKQLKKNIASDLKYIVTLNAEQKMIAMGDRQRAQEIALRKLSADATDQQREAILAKAGAMYDEKEAIKQLEEKAKPFADAWEAATERIDSAFVDAWNGAFDSFSDFADGIKNAFKQLLAELAHLAITKPILISAGLGGSSAASAASDISSVSGMFSAVKTAMAPAALLVSASDMLWKGVTFLESTLANAGFNSAANGLYNAASNMSNLPGGLAGGVMLTAGAGFAGSYAGNVAGEGLFGKQAESSWGSTILGGVGAFMGGPVGAAIGGFFGGLLDVAAGGDGKERITLGIEASNRDKFGDSLKAQEIAASGLQLSALSKRIGDGGAAAVGLLDGFLAVDSLFSSGARATGNTFDLTNYSLAGGASQAGKNNKDQHFFGSGKFDKVSEEDLENALANYTTSLIDAAISQGDFSDGVAVKLQKLDGTIEEIVAGFTAIFELESMKMNISDLFKAPMTEAETTKKFIDDLTIAWYDLAGRALPESREELLEYVSSIDVANEANEDLIAGIYALAPAMDGFIDHIEAIEIATESAISNEVDWIGYRASEIEKGYRLELNLIQSAHNEKMKSLQAEQRLARSLLNTVSAMKLSNISPLSAGDQLSFARSELARIQLGAEGGDLNAIGQLGSATQSYLKELSSYAPNSALYTSEFKRQTGYLEQMGISMGGYEDTNAAIERLSQSLLNETRKLTRQVEKELEYLSKMATGSADIFDLMLKLPDNLAAALKGILQGDSIDNSAPPSSLSDPIRELYSRGLGREADAGGYAYWTGQLAAGMSWEEIKAAFFNAGEMNGEQVTPFALGGIVTKPTLGLLAEAGRSEAVIPLDQGGIQIKGNAEMLTYIKSTNKEMKNLRADIARLTEQGAQVADAQLKQGSEHIKVTDKVGRSLRQDSKAPV